MNSGYRGRFAPTPSGPLHFGSLVAAVGSYLEARSRGGEWWLRIDDLDTPRVQPGAVDAILRCLERHGFAWDGPVLYQSRRTETYHAALHRLRNVGGVYPCACTRADIARAARQGPEGPVYPGTCRHGMASARRARAWRLCCEAAAEVPFDDPVQGRMHVDLAGEYGDFVLYRSDGIYAFHLASAVDDMALAMTDIVRGADLLPSSARQMHLIRMLGGRPPRYVHLPIARDAAGEKLSKQTHAPALDESRPQLGLARALAFLGQSPPADLAQASLTALWQWATANWRLAAVPRTVQRDDAGSSFASPDRSAGNA